MSKKIKQCAIVIALLVMLMFVVSCGSQTPASSDNTTNEDTAEQPIANDTSPVDTAAADTSGDDTSSTVEDGTTSPATDTTAANGDDNTPEQEDPLKEILESKHKLSFGEDGNFKILVLSDIHASTPKLNSETVENIKLLVEREMPDLVILDGDNTWYVSNANVLKSCISEIVKPIEALGIPWAHTYGNHDAEGNNVPKEKQQEIYESFEYCVSKAGDEDLTGVGNYLLPIYSSDGENVEFAVWVLDSGSDLSAEEKRSLFPVTTVYEGHPGSNYDYIRPDQIRWYSETSALLKASNGGKVVPGLMAFHIPLQESYIAWENRGGLTYTGDKREDVCASAVNSGLFSVLLQNGDIKAVVNGHDHINDFMIEYYGIKLCQAVTPTAENIYHDDSILGGRVFVISEENPSEVETYISYVHEQAQKPDFSDAEELPSGSVYDFETGDPEFTINGFDNDTAESSKIDEISVRILDGVGLNGSRGLAVTREKWNSTNAANNAEFKWSTDGYGKLGNNKYLCVWMDMSTNSIDFRKACWGIVTEYEESRPFRTDNYDSRSPFYYLADGSDTWEVLYHGSDGCFGEGDGESVKGLKGWFAFPIEYMTRSGDSLDENSIVTGFYFYFCLSESGMAGKDTYIDNITLVEDYKTFLTDSGN